MKQLMLTVAAIALFLTAAVVPSMADGFPIPTGNSAGTIHVTR